MSDPQQKYKLLISYEGTHYNGWQVQPNGPSIQTHIQKVLETILRAPIALTGSGRTDAGVHALGQVAHFTTATPIDAHRFLLSANALLPDDIRIHDIQPVHESFHARYSATGKIYHYHLHLDRTIDPFKRHYSLHVLHKADLDLLFQASKYFIGTRDFTSFANEAHRGSASRDPVRTLKRLDIVEEKGGLRLEFEADGFLYKMVRNIVGTLLDVSAKKITLEELANIFDAKDRRKAGKSAAARGLFLVHVHYENPSDILSNDSKWQAPSNFSLFS